MNGIKSHLVLALMGLIQAAGGGPLDTWTWRNPLPTGNVLNAITFGEGRFVAAGGIGTIVTSTNGIDWVLVRSGTTNWLWDVTYFGGQFVAVGEAGTIVASTDGVNWNTRSSGITDRLSRITYGNGQFVGVGRNPKLDGPATIVTSSDGSLWFPQSTVIAPYVGRIVYGNGQFVAETGGSTIPWWNLWTSPDGVNRNWGTTGTGRVTSRGRAIKGQKAL